MRLPLPLILALALPLGCNDLLSNSSPGEGGSGGGGSDATTSSGTGANQPLPPSGNAEGNNATIVSWNLETFPLYDVTAEKAAGLVAHLAPDVLAVQEVADEAAFMAFVDSLGDYDAILNTDPDGYLRLGLAYRRDRVTLVESETLFIGDGWAFPRPPLRAKLVIEGDTSIDFDIIVVHQKAQVDAESKARRLAGSQALDAWLRDRLENSDEQDYLVVGDFNDRLLDPPGDNVFTPFLEQPDVYAFLTLDVEQSGGFSYLPFQSMIDHALVTNDMLAEIGTGFSEVLALEQSVGNYALLSDHRPVRCWLSW
jgi:Endonuclease/Exonuclease/phosphatase family